LCFLFPANRNLITKQPSSESGISGNAGTANGFAATIAEKCVITTGKKIKD
jgi:hypothetical protein